MSDKQQLIEQVHGMFSEVEAKVERAKRDADRVRKGNQKLFQKNRELTATVETLTAQLAQANEKSRAKVAENHWRAQIVVLESDLALANQKVAVLQADQETFKADAQKMHAFFQRSFDKGNFELVTESANLQLQYMQKERLLRTEIAELERALIDARGKAAQLAEVQAAYKFLQDDHKALTLEAEKFRSQLSLAADASARAKNLENMVKELQQDQSAQYTQGLRTQVAALQADLATLKAKYEKGKEQYEKLEDHVNWDRASRQEEQEAIEQIKDSMRSYEARAQERITLATWGARETKKRERVAQFIYEHTASELRLILKTQGEKDKDGTYCMEAETYREIDRSMHTAYVHLTEAQKNLLLKEAQGLIDGIDGEREEAKREIASLLMRI